jgi:predicted TIM-barrel enzyme
MRLGRAAAVGMPRRAGCSLVGRILVTTVSAPVGYLMLREAPRRCFSIALLRRTRSRRDKATRFVLRALHLTHS